MKPSVKLLVAAMLSIIISGCGDAEQEQPPAASGQPTLELPTEAISDDVAMLLWIDIERMTPNQVLESFEGMVDAVLDGAEQQEARKELRRKLAFYEKLHADFTEVGGKGFLIGFTSGGNMFILIHVSEGTDRRAIRSALDHLPARLQSSVWVGPYAKCWLVVTDDQNRRMLRPVGGTKPNAKAFENLLDQHRQAPVRAAVRMTHTLRGELLKDTSIDLIRECKQVSLGLQLGRPSRVAMSAAMVDEQAAGHAVEEMRKQLVVSA